MKSFIIILLSWTITILLFAETAMFFCPVPTTSSSRRSMEAQYEQHQQLQRLWHNALSSSRSTSTVVSRLFSAVDDKKEQRQQQQETTTNRNSSIEQHLHHHAQQQQQQHETLNGSVLHSEHSDAHGSSSNSNDDDDRFVFPSSRRFGSPSAYVVPTELLYEKDFKSGKSNGVVLDPQSYESELLNLWSDKQTQRGFDWEIEKLRRYFAGLRMRSDGTWVKQPSLFDFLVSRTRASTLTEDLKKNILPTPKPVNIFDVATLFAINILSSMGFGPALGMAAVPDAIIGKYEGSFFSFIKGVLGGDLQALAGGPLFLLLAKYYQVHGPIFNLSFGPKSFLIISDPVMARHILRSSPDAYDKGVLAEILEPIMGKGLIPADPDTWRVRRRAIVPGFHKRWLNRMVTLFADCADRLSDSLDDIVENKKVIDMEEKFCSVTLDIIGKAVFNYDFGSVTKESPIVKAVYRILREAEHRSSSFIPYWSLPYADKWMEGQREFRKDMTMMDDILADLINRAVLTRREATLEELEERDNDDDPSLLRFLADMRGEDLSSKVLRDDLMTMLIAGHETTAAMLTWTLFELSNGPQGMLDEIRAEVRSVLKGKDRPDYDDIVNMPKLRLALIESLRLYPEPPVLIRRARVEDTLPTGGSGIGEIKLLRGTDIFVSTWNLHRSSELWEDPERYDPTRWEREFSNSGIKDWNGYDPSKISGLYPNEQTSDHAFLPFGAGQRKCVGDQFAMMEATVTMAMMLNKFDFTFAIDPKDVGMKTGATIHTMNGLQMTVSKLPKDDDDDDISETTTGWWEQQHLSRGLNVDGRPYETTEDSAWQTTARGGGATSAATKPSSGGCPVSH